MAYDKKRLDTLIRQGMMPAKSLPILHRALDKLKKGVNLTPYEREGISKLMDKVMGFQFGDDITYNRARLHTQRTRYQTEEIGPVDKGKEGDVIVYDGSTDEAESKKDKKVKKNAQSKLLKTNKGDGMKPEEEIKEASASRPADKDIGDKESPKQGSSVKPEITDGPKQDSKPSIKEGLISDLDSEGMRARASRLGKKKGKVSKEKLAKELPAALRKEKQKAGLSEDMVKFNELYKENLERALANNNVDNVRDIPLKIKSALFKHVEEATYSDKQIKMAKGIAFDKRHKGGDMTGAYKKMEKIKKGLGDTPQASKALQRANEELEQPLDEGALKDFALGHGYFEKDKEGAAKRKDPQWLSKQAASKKTISYAKKKPAVKESKMATKDHDGDGKIESGKDEYFGSKDKAIKKALKKVPALKKEEVEETEVKKTPNQAVRDVHRTVADVLAGRTIEVSDEPLVIDPNVESQAELDRTVNNVQEGAREDALRDISRDKDLAKPKKPAPKPGKSKHDGSENKGPDHIVAQLRKAVSLGDKHDGVKFQDGKTHKVSAAHAHKFLNKYMAGKPADKEKMQSHGHASHDNFKKHID
tara:strand:- start:2168 stop:3934 length:1767 start_codon:yes stop_codon:yes gene_type:complete